MPAQELHRLLARKGADAEKLAAGVIENGIMQWKAIYVIANLASVDNKKQIEKVFDRYFAPISGPALITAANVVRGGAKIAAAKPQLADRVAKEILKVENARYKTPECRRIALGHAIEAFDHFYAGIKNKKPVIGPVRRQLESPRNATRKKAQRFMKRHGLN